jgi:DNA excision repair protein ERCC-4
MMRSSIEGSGLTGADILGRFVQVSTFDMSTDFSEDSSVPFTVAGAFTAGYVYSIYLADDFLAFPSNVYKYNYTSGTDSSSTFILGFDLSAEDRATPYCYGHIPGTLGNNYYMDKWDGHLRIASSDYFVVDTVNWTTVNANKVYVLKLPNLQEGPGKMSLVGETENLTDENGYISGVRYIEDKAYISAYNWLDGQNNPFIIVDLSDHKNPHVVGKLNTTGYFPYLQSIDSMNPSSVLGVGYETDVTSDTWQSFITLSLIDTTTPASPKVITSYREAGSSSDALYDFLAVRYLPESKNLIIPVSKSDYYGNSMYNYTEGFAVYDISEGSITPLFNVTHSNTESYCWYDASIPSRSFVIQSELITIKGHTAISTDMKTGSFISTLDLDVGFNYSFCEPWLSSSVYYYYGDEAVAALDNSTRLI